PHQLLADWHWLVRHVCGVYSRLCFSVLTCADGPYRRYAGLFTYRVSTALEFDDDSICLQPCRLFTGTACGWSTDRRTVGAVSGGADRIQRHCSIPVGEI